MKDRILELKYRHGAGLLPIPPHLHFFYELGRWLERNREDELSIVAAFIVPSRGFISSFLALGLLMERIGGSEPGGVQSDLFDQIVARPEKGMVIEYVLKGKRKRGEVEGIFETGGEKAIKVKFRSDKNDSNGAWEVLFKHRVEELKLFTLEPDEIPTEIIGAVPGANNEFVRAVAPNLLSIDSVDGFELPVAVVGTRTWIREECMKQKFQIFHGDKLYSGSLNTLLKYSGLSSLATKPRVVFAKGVDGPFIQTDFAIYDGVMASLESINQSVAKN